MNVFNQKHFILLIKKINKKTAWSRLFSIHYNPGMIFEEKKSMKLKNKRIKLKFLENQNKHLRFTTEKRKNKVAAQDKFDIKNK